MVAPRGRTKRVTRGSTPLFSSAHLIERGRVAELKMKLLVLLLVPSTYSYEKRTIEPMEKLIKIINLWKIVLAIVTDENHFCVDTVNVLYSLTLCKILSKVKYCVGY